MYSILVQILPGLENGSLTVNLTIRTLNWVVCEASIVLIQLSTPIIKTFHQGLTWERASLMAQRLKRLPPMRETRVQSLGREDPLEKEMAIYTSILAWRIPWTEKPSKLQSTGSQRVGQD